MLLAGMEKWRRLSLWMYWYLCFWSRILTLWSVWLALRGTTSLKLMERSTHPTVSVSAAARSTRWAGWKVGFLRGGTFCLYIFNQAKIHFTRLLDWSGEYSFTLIAAALQGSTISLWFVEKIFSDDVPRCDKCSSLVKPGEKKERELVSPFLLCVSGLEAFHPSLPL